MDSPSLIIPYMPIIPVNVMLIKWDINALANPAEVGKPNKENAPTIATS